MNKEQQIEVNNDDIIVSATDSKGKIVYANKTFCEIAGYSLEEVLHRPHNIIRHEDMPKVIFKMLWQTVLSQNNLYAIVKNKTKEGSYYWVKAYLTPVVQEGKIEKIISYRKCITKRAQEVISKLYATMVRIENSQGMDAAERYLQEYLAQRNLSYTQFINRVAEDKNITEPKLLSMDMHGQYIACILFQESIRRRCQSNEENRIKNDNECAFGKWLQEVEHEPFARQESFQRIKQIHKHIHASLQQYCQTPKEQKDDSVFATLKKDTDELFATLQNLTDQYKE